MPTRPPGSLHPGRRRPCAILRRCPGDGGGRACFSESILRSEATKDQRSPHHDRRHVPASRRSLERAPLILRFAQDAHPASRIASSWPTTSLRNSSKMSRGRRGKGMLFRVYPEERSDEGSTEPSPRPAPRACFAAKSREGSVDPSLRSGCPPGLPDRFILADDVPAQFFEDVQGTEGEGHAFQSLS